MLPEKFKKRMREYLGETEYDRFIISFDNDERYHALRMNNLKCSNQNIKDKLIYLKKSVPWEESAYYYEEENKDTNCDEINRPGKHPYHEAGVYYIQEPSAMAPVHYLDPKPGDKILDLCAAPGGKSTQIATKMDGKGILVSNEINRDRAKILSLNVERLGIPNALVLNETPQHLSQIFECYFDKILVDAPCSGEGMFRKNDNAADEWSPENVAECALRQAEILDCASKMLLPGGRIVYSTCTFAADENEESILKFLFYHHDFHVEQAYKFDGMESGQEAWISEELISKLTDVNEFRLRECLSEINRSIRLWPHKLMGEGHFLCVLKRDGELLKDGADRFVPGGKIIPAKTEYIKPFESFFREAIKYDEKSLNISKGRIKCTLCSDRVMEGIMFLFGEQLYLAPDNMPSIIGLKCMRPGLHLGTIKKDRFEPSHALALFLRKEDVILVHDFASESDDIKSFLNGQTLRIDSKNKGWTLITTDGYSIGWAKAAGGMLKNHYPKGLRINY